MCESVVFVCELWCVCGGVCMSVWCVCGVYVHVCVRYMSVWCVCGIHGVYVWVYVAEGVCGVWGTYVCVCAHVCAPMHEGM